jgi:hypothetical protein
MSLFQPRSRTRAIFLLGGMVLSCLAATPGKAVNYGRITGTVSDPQGNPLMGATVSIVGPLLTGLQPMVNAAERVITDAHGKFTVERLVPGFYSLQVTSATRLPILRNRVLVEAGGSLRENFVLSDILAPLRLKVPAGSVATWGEDWKWVLRTSAATRPVLRYQEVSKTKTRSKSAKAPLPSSQRLIAMSPGSTRRRALAGDPGMGSVLAYLRPLSEDTDLLVAGSMGASGFQASSLATVLRKDVLKGDPQELSLVVHQLNFADGVPLASGEGRDSLSHAQALAVNYTRTRRLFSRLALTTGFEVDYLNAAQDALSSRPIAKLEYQVSPSNSVALRYGVARLDEDGSLLDRIGVLTAFPRVTMRGYRPQMEKLNHAELSFRRSLGRESHFELAAYRDDFDNTAVWGFGGTKVLSGLAGSFLPNPAANGVTLNAGNYTSSGLRVAFTRNLGGYVQVAVLYALGDALTMDAVGLSGEEPVKNLRSLVRPQRSQTVGGRVAARIPVSKTRITTSYEWLPAGRVTEVDPYAQASMQLQPYLGVQIRQPLPALAFLPARIEALADFRNLLAQGYTSLANSGDESLVMTPAYRSFRGGFSVQF